MRVLVIFFVLTVPALAAEPLFAAIRTGDVRTVKTQLGSKSGIDTLGVDGLTPLMYAVMTASVPVMGVLLDAGAGVNQANAEGIAPLHMAAFDLAKTRLLIDRGVNVNAATQAGETALIIAADRNGSSPVVELLLAKGADPSAKTASGVTALIRAAVAGDAAVMRLLLAKGARVSDSPQLASAAAFGHCRECLELALAQGASANGARNRRTALQDAAAFGDVEMVRMLVEKGADIQAADARGYTALMRAALSYEPSAVRVVEYLLAKGASTSPKNETGETALSFALRFGDTPIAATLRKAEAPEGPPVPRVPAPLAENTAREAIERSLPLLQRIGEPLSTAMKCTSCHHNSLPAMTVAMARSRGLKVDSTAAQNEHETAIGMAKGRRNRTNLLGIGVPDINPYPLIGIAAENGAANSSTDAMVHNVSTRQDPSGRFRGQDYRPPQEYTDITFTATALRAMQLYSLPGRATEFKERVQRAGRWLAAQTPRDTEEHTLRLMGLAWWGGVKSMRDDAVKALLSLQRQDGGWAQTATLSTDAYATGQSLYALHLAGVPANHAGYQRGVSFLLKSQRPDGSWSVISRSHPVQPLIDGGHPYGNHQWISASGSAWSTMALLATMPDSVSPRASLRH